MLEEDSRTKMRKVRIAENSRASSVRVLEGSGETSRQRCATEAMRVSSDTPFEFSGELLPFVNAVKEQRELSWCAQITCMVSSRDKEHERYSRDGRKEKVDCRNLPSAQVFAQEPLSCCFLRREGAPGRMFVARADVSYPSRTSVWTPRPGSHGARPGSRRDAICSCLVEKKPQRARDDF